MKALLELRGAHYKYIKRENIDNIGLYTSKTPNPKTIYDYSNAYIKIFYKALYSWFFTDFENNFDGIEHYMYPPPR